MEVQDDNRRKLVNAQGAWDAVGVGPGNWFDDWGIQSQWQCDYSTFSLQAEWYKKTLIPCRRVIHRDTSIGFVLT